jgi:L-threonylcarbamoyladenylate synthase
METRLLSVDASTPNPALIAEAAAVLRRGGLVAFPTETVYGLGANALNPEAVACIFAAKGRPANNPLIVHIADVDQARALVSDWPPAAAALARAFWPGPLTLVLSRGPRVPDVVTAGGPTVAIRVPAHLVALALLRESNLPLAAPSANRSSYLSPTRADHALRDLDGRIDMILDAGPTPGGVESTILDLTPSPPRLLRPGLITPAQMESVVGPIERGSSHAVSRDAPLPSPGLLPRHYAPRAILECTESDAPQRVATLAREGKRLGWLAFNPADPSSDNLSVIQMPSDPGDYAAELYAALHTLDQAGLEQIIVSMPPDTEEWLAVRDRLRRAARAPV